MKYLTLLFSLLVVGCQSTATEQVFSTKQLGSKQMVVVTTADWQKNVGTLRTFSLVNGKWQEADVTGDVNIGRTGLAWGLGLHPSVPGQAKVEGDGKAPAGIFSLGDAFGAHKAIQTGLNYQQLNKNDFCIDVKGSPLYNQTVNTEDVGEAAVKGSSEPMRRDIHKGDKLYNKGIFINHNPNNIDGAGSCIFVHIWRELGSPTAGCTAMDEAMIDKLLAWLNQQDQPIFVILPEAEYKQRKAQWQLPSL